MPHDDAITVKTCLAGLCLAVLAATVIDVPPVEAQTYTAQPDRPVNRPRARITVEPRSFLDAGTEVLPGERKFTDYAFPAGSYSMPLSVVQSTGGRVAWHRSRLPGPLDLPSRYNPYGWYPRVARSPRLTAMTGAECFCNHCAVILAACAVSVKFLKSVAMVRLKSAGLTAASDRRRVR